MEKPITEKEMDEYIEKGHPSLILSSVDEEEYKDVFDNDCDCTENVDWNRAIQAATDALD